MFSFLVRVSLLSLCLLSSVFFSLIAQATVPPSARFQIPIDTYFGDYPVEYGANYRLIGIDNYPFQVGFYNTTPDAFTLALRMGNPLASPKMYFVWEANRGRPVRLNATLTFGEDGNLVLADVDGSIAWQTDTAHKGVVGLQLLPNGNLVLHDSKGIFIWQSFDHPTDTLLVGQSLRVGGTAKLVSRASEKENSDGPYSLVVEPKRLAMYYKNPDSSKPYLYYTADKFSVSKGRIENVTLYSQTGDTYGFYYDLTLSLTPFQGVTLTTVNYNTTLSFLRLGLDGNLRIHTNYDRADTKNGFQVTFTFFYKDSDWESECQLPERCGMFGLCEDNQCVACPLPNGLIGWSKNCQPVKPPSCGSKNFYYCKLEGVDHYNSKYLSRSRAMNEDDCGKKCSSDCKCLGYFYNKDTSKCLIAYDLHTLTRVANSTHVGYIKVPNNIT
ncbi:unnamed protein product [Dovyalis caffra]|uniref:Bulb-type lectin domain-containing protein n=1 Tax=Dovyalis caffra TaxID=77055 RepID=A0AAV1RCF2_9ROSI|nr:unnamed protein product [Dovyalis caffra]